MAALKGLFDVKSLLESGSLGQWRWQVKAFEPTFDLELSSAVHSEELPLQTAKIDSDWLDIDSDEEQ